MKAELRAMVAFIAGELISKKGKKQIFDYGRNIRINFSSNISKWDVEVTDLKSKETLSGGAFGNEFNLYNYSDQYPVKLKISGTSFSGTEGKLAKRFTGTVNSRDGLITITETETRKQYCYSLS